MMSCNILKQNTNSVLFKLVSYLKEKKTIKLNAFLKVKHII